MKLRRVISVAGLAAAGFGATAGAAGAAGLGASGFGWEGGVSPPSGFFSSGFPYLLRCV